MAPPYVAIAERKQADREALIPAEWRLKSTPPREVLNVMDVPRTCGILSAREVDITENHDATALAQAIREQKFTSVEVTTAYCKRAAIAQQLTNCLTEIMFDAGLKRAALLDHHLAQTGKPFGPLHGVPISIKDTFKVPNFDSSLGLAALSYRPASEMAHLVYLLLSAGAVIYCKTNIPQTLATLDSVNHMFGRTLNPLNHLVTAGGSSGGEGALVALKGSAMGVGTDIGGSIRVPAMCNGLYGIKSSAHRVPYSGQESGGPPGSIGGLVASAGPLARSLRDCELMLRTIADARPWEQDPLLIPGEWESSALDTRTLSPPDRPLKIGVLSTDGLVSPLPPIASLLREVSGILGKSSSFQIYDIPKIPLLATAQSVSNKLMGLEGGNSTFDLLEAMEEPLIPWLDGKMRRRKPATLEQTRALNAQKERLCVELARKLWRTQDGKNEPLDAIICPVAPHPTPLIDSWVGVGYTINWVMTDYPAGVIPVREFVEKDLEGEINEMHLKHPLSAWDKGTQMLWGKTKEDRKHYLGTWLSIQVLAPRLQERRLVRCMEAIDNVLKESQKTTSSRL